LRIEDSLQFAAGSFNDEPFGEGPPGPIRIDSRRKEEVVMSYYFSKTLILSFDKALSRVTEELKKEGFGILTDIDVKATLKKKLDVEFRNYRILGACNPPFAYKALQAEDKIGTMLPCNVIVQEISDGQVEVTAIDPLASMQAVENPALRSIAAEISKKLRTVIDSV
jgi:uncharacterized protein (DUF302 family)